MGCQLDRAGSGRKRVAVREPSRILALDGLRAYAAVAVLLWHELPHAKTVLWAGVGQYGSMGVRLFFVISGFVITRLLLQARDRQAGAPLRQLLVPFYVRRASRIIPLYFAALIVGMALGFEALRQDTWWYWLYLSNIREAMTGISPESVGHFWSLAVEEQFYLCWPVVVLLTPRAFLPVVIVSAMAIGFGVRIGLHQLGLPVWSDMVMLAHLPPLGAGALLAAVPRLDRRMGWQCASAGLALLGTQAACEWSGVFHLQTAHLAWATVSGVVLTVGVVILAATPGRMICLTATPVLWLGTISYGIYVIHYMAPEGLSLLGVLPPHADLGWLRFTLVSVVTIGLASLSWVTFERPLLRWRDRLGTRSSAIARHDELPDPLTTI